MGTNPMYYAPHEMVHSKRYRPTELTGFSPIITAWMKVRGLQQQDKYIMELYEGKRPPKGLLVFNTTNRDSLSDAWSEMLKRAKENPHLPAIIGMENKTNGSKVVDFIDFMKSLDELQYTEQREEFRRVLGAMYGVSPVFQADVSTGGGLNNEGLQITVTNDAIQDGQKNNYNTKILKRIVKELGASGWSLLLRPSEEQDEMARLVKQEQSLRNAELASRLGLKAKYDSRQGECIIEDGEIQEPAQEQDMFGDLAGMEGDNMPTEGQIGEPQAIEPDRQDDETRI